MIGGRPEDSVFTFTLAKFVILMIAILALVILLVIGLSLRSNEQVADVATATTEATRDAFVDTTDTALPASDTPIPPSETPLPPTDTLVPPSDTPLPATATQTAVLPVSTDTVVAATDIPQPTSTATDDVPPTATVQALSVPSATDDLPSTAVPPPSNTPTEEPSPTLEPSDTPTSTPTATEVASLVITLPLNDAAVPPGRLEIAGMSAPNVRINVVEDGETIVAASSDNNGNWNAILPQGLPTGSHTLHAEAVAADGEILEESPVVTLNVIEAVVPTSGGDRLPRSGVLLVALTLLSLALVFTLGGAILREWERTRNL